MQEAQAWQEAPCKVAKEVTATESRQGELLTQPPVTWVHRTQLQ